MKKIISVCIIFAFLLTSFAGCGKLKSSPVSGLNQSDTSASSEVNSQLDTSASSEVNSQSEASSEVGAKDLTKKESWKEWICRQWNDNKWYWIGGVVVVVGTDIYYRRRCEVFRLSDKADKRRRSMEERQSLSSEIDSLREQRRHLTEATKSLTEKILPLVKERQSLSDESQRLTEKIDFLKEQKKRLLGAI